MKKHLCPEDDLSQLFSTYIDKARMSIYLLMFLSDKVEVSDALLFTDGPYIKAIASNITTYKRLNDFKIDVELDVNNTQDVMIIDKKITLVSDGCSPIIIYNEAIAKKFLDHYF